MTYHSNTQTSQDILNKIKKLLLNYDLTIEYAESQIALRNSWMEVLKHKTSKKNAKRFINAKIDKERFIVFKNQLEQKRDNLLSITLEHCENYIENCKNILYLYFFKDKNIDDIISITKLEKEEIEQVIKQINENIINNITI